MTRLDDARPSVREFLKLMCGDGAPEWRTCYLDGPAAEPTGLAPVCPDEGHEATDGNVYACCPEPVIECQFYKLAEYLVALLNADRANEARAETAPVRHERDHCLHGTSVNVECGGCDALGQLGGAS